MNLGLDIDDTITKAPAFFRLLSRSVRASGGKVYVVSSRTAQQEVQTATEAELGKLGLEYDDLFLLPGTDVARRLCPHSNLDWYQRYIWQKVDHCLRHQVDVYFDDELKVIDLFKTFAPRVHVFQAR